MSIKIFTFTYVVRVIYFQYGKSKGKRMGMAM